MILAPTPRFPPSSNETVKPMRSHPRAHTLTIGIGQVTTPPGTESMFRILEFQEPGR